MRDCRHCESALPLEPIGDRLVCPCCSRPADGAADTALASPVDAGEAIDFEALRRQRGPGGRFLAGVPGPQLKHGLRSTLLLDLPDLAAEHADKVRAIEVDLGDDIGTLKSAAIHEAARLALIVDSLGADLLAKGVLTSKGRTRAALSAYTMALDRLRQLMVLLGVERRTKPVDPLEAVRRAVREVNE